MRNWNPSATHVLTGSKMNDWKVLNDEFFASLVVSDERAAEIMRLYPEDEMTGRPGVFASPEKKLRAYKSAKIRNVDVDSEEPDAIVEQDETKLAA